MIVRNRPRYSEFEAIAEETELPDATARFAAELISKFGAIAAIEDGEDTVGRQKMRLQNARELVERSFAIAEQYYEVARSRGYMVQCPARIEKNEESK